MDRIILLALLGIPILIVIPVAMFAHGLNPAVSPAWSRDYAAALHGNWQTRDAPAFFEISRTQQGS